MKVKVVGQRSWSNDKKRVLTSLLPCFTVKVIVLGQGQRSGLRSFVKVKGQGETSDTQQSILGARICRVQQRAIRVITSLRYLCVRL